MTIQVSVNWRCWAFGISFYFSRLGWFGIDIGPLDITVYTNESKQPG